MDMMTSNIHGVESVDVYDCPLAGIAPGETRATKDIHIRLKSGGEIVIYCYMGAVKEGGADGI